MTRFVDFWSNLEEQNTRLRAAFYAALIVAGIEAWGLMRIALAPAPVYVVPGATTSGLYRADETWQEAARHFAESYVMTVANFTPETAQRSFQTALQYLSPTALSLARTQLDEELTRMKRDRISSQCVPEAPAWPCPVILNEGRGSPAVKNLSPLGRHAHRYRATPATGRTGRSR